MKARRVLIVVATMVLILVVVFCSQYTDRFKSPFLRQSAQFYLTSSSDSATVSWNSSENSSLYPSFYDQVIHFTKTSNETTQFNFDKGPFDCIVIGAMSFIGSRLTAALHEWKGCSKVIPIEDSINIEPDVMRWYRWTQLTTELNLPTTLIEFEMDISKLIRIIKSSHKNYIFYVPTGVTTHVTSVNDAKLLQVRLETVVNFQKLLNILLTKRESVKGFALMSFGNEKDSRQKNWLYTLEQVFLSFQHEHLMTNAIVLVKGSTNGLYGPWQDSNPSTYCWYIDDIIHLVLHFNMTNSPLIFDCYKKCSDDHQKNKDLTQLWIKKFRENSKNQSSNVVTGTVINVNDSKTKGHHYSSRIFHNDAGYFKEYLLTALHYPSIEVRIIHNDLPKDLINRIEKGYSRCKFIHYLSVNDRVVVDQRFYMLYDYLLRHPEIKSLINGDTRDVVFLRDPFEVMSKIGDLFYVTFDMPFLNSMKYLHWVEGYFKTCWPKYKHMGDFKDLFGAFNSGVMGGSRHVMLSVLARETLYLDAASRYGVCDQTASQITFHRYYYDQTFGGYPFNGAYLLGIPGPFGAAVKHKYFAYLRSM